jgi:hypothetical protein
MFSFMQSWTSTSIGRGPKGGGGLSALGPVVGAPAAGQAVVVHNTMSMPTIVANCLIDLFIWHIDSLLLNQLTGLATRRRPQST